MSSAETAHLLYTKECQTRLTATQRKHCIEKAALIATRRERSQVHSLRQDAQEATVQYAANIRGLTVDCGRKYDALQARLNASVGVHDAEKAKQKKAFADEVLALELKLKNTLLKTKSAKGAADVRISGLLKEKENLEAAYASACDTNKTKEVRNAVLGGLY